MSFSYEKLSSNPVYFPIERGLYEVGPGLKNFGADFGNGLLDQCLFQITRDFPKFYQNKVAAIQERANKYIQEKNLNPLAAKAIADFIIQKLVSDYPALFHLQMGEGRKLFCALTNKEIDCDRLSARELLDALMLQVPEDIAILEKNQDQDWISYLHLCSPSHWAAEDKIGLNFTAVHMPVPGIGMVLKASHSLTEAMIHKGPFVRFVWSFVTDVRLNHHPVAPVGEDPIRWKGRSFNSQNEEPFYLRIERQTTHGFPSVNASLFTIGLTFIPASEIKANEKWRTQLSSALESMTPESKRYKGVADCFSELIQYLKFS
jgi:dimethylamine monooxygenase subunit A